MVQSNQANWKAVTILVLAVLFVMAGPVQPAYAAACGTDAFPYRTKSSGDWAADSTWEVFNGTTWTDAGCWPTNLNGPITVRSGYLLTIVSALTVDETLIEAGAQVTVNSGVTWTIANGAGDDLSVSGIVTVNGQSGNVGAITITGGGTIVFNDGGIYQHNHSTSNGTIPTATWNNGAKVEIIGYTTITGYPGNLGQTFANFTWNCQNQTSDINLQGVLKTITGNLSIVSTNTGSLRLTKNTLVTLNIGGDISLTGGKLEATNGSAAPEINVGGNWTKDTDSTFISTNSTVIFNGSAAQTIGGDSSTIFNNLTVNNPSGVLLDGVDATVNGTLHFLDGMLDTGADNTLILASGGSVTGAGAGSSAGDGQYVNGNLRKTIPAGDATVSFEVGDETTYAPVSVTFKEVVGGTGTLTASTTPGQHPYYADSSISSANYINRYWTLTPSGLTFTSYDAQVTFAASDIVGAPDTSTLALQKYSTSWTDPVSHSSTATSVTGTGFTSFSDFAAGESGVPTPVTVSYFRASRLGNGVQFDWSTSTETGNVGFNFYAEVAGEKIRLNGLPIPSQAVDSLGRLDYSWFAESEGEVFFIEEIGIAGDTVLHGPFEIGMDYGSRADEMTIDWPAIGAAHQAADASRQQELLPELALPAAASDGNESDDLGPLPSRAILNLIVRQTGIHRVTYEMLRDAGLDLAGVSSLRIKLSNFGQPVPIYVEPHGRLGPGAFFEFYGRALDTIYTDANVYALTVEMSALRVPVVEAPPGNLTRAPAFYLETLTVNRQRAYADYAPGNDVWYDTEMLAFTTPRRWEFPFQVDGLIRARPAALTLTVWGVTGWPQSPDHHLAARLNGTQVAEVFFNDLVEETISVTLPSGVLHEGANTLELLLPGDTGVDWDMVNLDKFTVTYARSFQARDGQLVFTSAGRTLQVSDLPGEEVVVYRLGKKSLARLGSVQVEAAGDSFTASFAGQNRPATYLVYAPEALLVPEIEIARIPSALDQPADYLIISHPDFIAGLAPLVEARQSQGLTVSVVDVTDLYARYTFGVFDPQAIQQYIAYAQKSLGTRFVLLVGGDTYDYRNYLGLAGLSFIPSLYTSTGDIARYVPADPLFADVDGDRAPDLAIGRFPVRTPAELGLLIRKTLAYADKDYARTAVFASDLNDGSVSFKDMSDTLAAGMPETWSVETIHLDDVPVAAARARLLASMNRGVALVNFTGHSGPVEWTFSKLFTTKNAAVLTNAGRPFVAVQWGCWNNYYVHPTTNFLVQGLLLSGDRGAVATLGASTLTASDSEQKLALLLMPRLTAPGITVGEALQSAKSELAQTHPDLLDVLLGWSLMGDPALVVDP